MDGKLITPCIYQCQIKLEFDLNTGSICICLMLKCIEYVSMFDFMHNTFYCEITLSYGTIALVYMFDLKRIKLYLRIQYIIIMCNHDENEW